MRVSGVSALVPGFDTGVLNAPLFLVRHGRVAADFHIYAQHGFILNHI